MNDQSAYRIREIDARKDIFQIPDLIEFCFRAYLDPDGIEFIKKLRSAAESLKKQSFYSFFPFNEMNINGYVCVNHDGVIIGNVNLFPVRVMNHFAYLIANVCVHPDYRRQGIGRSLIESALKYAKSHFVETVYLQVREETDDVIRLYKNLGFREDGRRTSWICPINGSREKILIELRHEKTFLKEKREYQIFFRRWYPEKIIWNLNYDPGLFQFGLFHRIFRSIYQKKAEFFKILDSDKRILCWIGWQPTSTFSNTLWFVPTDFCDENQAISILLSLKNSYSIEKPFQINFPKGSYAESFLTAGFFVQSRFVWMSKVVR
jgi:ribosomal protein S18 acetylase RimI-like enzyme